MDTGTEEEIIPLLRSNKEKQQPNSKNENEVKYTLQRDLKYSHGFAFIVGMLLGSGLFISPGLVAASSPNMFVAILAWIFSGLIAILGASCYCELASLFRRTGGAYLYICRTYHPVIGFTTACITVFVIEPTVTAIVTFSSGSYITKMFVADEESELFLWTARACGVAFLIALSLINCFGVRKFGFLQNVFSASQVLIFVFILGLGVWHLASVRNFENFEADVFVNNTLELFTWNGVRGFGDAMYAALWAYEGWSCVPFLMEELQNPDRNVPLVTFTSIPFVICMYTLVNLAFMTALSKDEMGKSATVGISLAAKVTGNKLTMVMPLLVAICCFGTLNSCIYISSRIYMAAAREGHLPSAFLWIHKKYRTPTLAIVCNFVVSLSWILLGNKLQTFITFFNFCVWLTYILTFVALLRVRHTQPHGERTYKVYLVTPIAMTVISIAISFLGVAASPVGCGVSLGIIVLSIPIYYVCIHRPCCSDSYLRKLEEVSKRILDRMGMVPSRPDELPE